jgi:predicted HTH transcriptional regulator
MLDAINCALAEALQSEVNVNEVIREGVNEGEGDGVSDAINDAVTTTANANGNLKLDALDQEILAIIQAHPYINQNQLVHVTNHSLSTIQRRIRKLRGQYIERIGSDKVGYWVLKKQPLRC